MLVHYTAVAFSENSNIFDMISLYVAEPCSLCFGDGFFMLTIKNGKIHIDYKMGQGLKNITEE